MWWPFWWLPVVIPHPKSPYSQPLRLAPRIPSLALLPSANCPQSSHCCLIAALNCCFDQATPSLHNAPQLPRAPWNTGSKFWEILRDHPGNPTLSPLACYSLTGSCGLFHAGLRAGKPGTTFVLCFCLPQGLEHTMDADGLVLRGRIPELVKAICSGISSLKPPPISPADSRFLPSRTLYPSQHIRGRISSQSVQKRLISLGHHLRSSSWDRTCIVFIFTFLTQCLAGADNINNNNTENYHFRTLCARSYSKYLTWNNDSIITTAL